SVTAPLQTTSHRAILGVTSSPPLPSGYVDTLYPQDPAGNAYPMLLSGYGDDIAHWGFGCLFRYDATGQAQYNSTDGACNYAPQPASPLPSPAPPPAPPASFVKLDYGPPTAETQQAMKDQGLPWQGIPPNQLGYPDWATPWAREGGAYAQDLD